MSQANAADWLLGQRVQPQVLIVEDDDFVSRLIEAVLIQAGYEVTTCPEGNQAIAYLQANTPNLILLDNKLPGMSGENILAWIEQQPRLQDTKVVMMSGGLLETDQSERVVTLLPKPFDLDELQEIAERCKPVSA